MLGCLIQKKTQKEEMAALTTLKKIEIPGTCQHRILKGFKSLEWSVCMVMGYSLFPGCGRLRAAVCM